MFFKKDQNYLMQINIGLDLFKLKKFFESNEEVPDIGELKSFPWGERSDIFDYEITWMNGAKTDLFFHKMPMSFTNRLEATVEIDDDYLIDFDQRGDKFILSAEHKGRRRLLLVAPLEKVISYRETGKQSIELLFESERVVKEIPIGTGNNGQPETLPIQESVNPVGVIYSNSLIAVSFGLAPTHFDLRH